MRRRSFPTLDQSDSLYFKHVLYKKVKNKKAIQKAAIQWMKVYTEQKISYNVNWFGMPIIQMPEDMLIMQELIFRTKPDVIIETGVAHGGSVLFYASLCELLKHGSVIGVDVDVRAHNRVLIDRHPFSARLTLIEGSSIEVGTIEICKKLIGNKKNVLVILDSNHRKQHVLKELENYSQFVSEGNYIVVFDTAMHYLAKAGYLKKYWTASDDWFEDTPKNAIDVFLKKHKDFVQDTYYEKFFVSYALGGFLKKR